jgi:hypothetical protein
MAGTEPGHDDGHVKFPCFGRGAAHRTSRVRDVRIDDRKPETSELRAMRCRSEATTSVAIVAFRTTRRGNRRAGAPDQRCITACCIASGARGVRSHAGSKSESSSADSHLQHHHHECAPAAPTRPYGASHRERRARAHGVALRTPQPRRSALRRVAPGPRVSRVALARGTGLLTSMPWAGYAPAAPTRATALLTANEGARARAALRTLLHAPPPCPRTSRASTP